MNEAMIENWNSVVKPTDTVFHLGDVALGKIATSLPLVGLLNGYKILVPGNHDRVFSGEKEKTRTRFMPEYEKVFQKIATEKAVFDGLPRPVLLCHFPYQGDSQENERHVDKRPKNQGMPLVHGHVHEKWRTNGRMFNVGVDRNDFTPVHEDVIADWIRSL